MKPISEHDVFREKELVSINVEIPKEINEQIYNAYLNEIHSGATSLTFEQFVGGLVNVGFNWMLYKHLKRTYDI